MWNRKRTAAFTLVALMTWAACSPEDYPTGSRFDPPPEEVELPDGELFFYVPPAGLTVTSVSVPGEFNGWTPADPAAQMIDLGDGRWVAGIDLAEGTYQYKYYINGNWAGDMCNDATYGDPDNEFHVDPNLTSCDPGGNAIRLVGEPAPTGHTFMYLPREDQDVEVVTVAGSFQDPVWTNTTDTLTNIWTLTVDMEPGTYEYKYVFNDGGWAGNMCDEGNWGNPAYGNAVDPDNDNCVAGGENAQITITESGPHTFRYIVPADADTIETIHVAGSFQDPVWVNNSPATEMVETFQRHYELEAGTYEYKFIFDGNWAGNMCTDTGNYGDPTTGLVDANNTDGCVAGGENAMVIVEE